MSQFGDKIKGLREEKNLTTRDLAEAVGIPQSRYSELEKGVRVPTEGQAARIEKFFGLDDGELAALL